jgi:hypothetical protein
LTNKMLKILHYAQNDKCDESNPLVTPWHSPSQGRKLRIAFLLPVKGAVLRSRTEGLLAKHLRFFANTQNDIHIYSINQKIMSLTIKRYRYLILLSILFLWVLVYYGTYRVISINIMDSWKVTVNRPIHKSHMMNE